MIPAGFLALHDDAVAALGSWTSPDAGQEDLRRAYLEHLAAHRDGVWREGPPAHLTVGMLVMDESGEHVLLTHHRKAQRWFQLGGHLEEQDATLAAAALREALEESGLRELSLVGGILQLDRHPLPGAFGRCREHLDVRYLATADRAATPVVSEESLDVAWWPVDELPNEDLGPLVAAGRRVLASR